MKLVYFYTLQIIIRYALVVEIPAGDVFLNKRRIVVNFFLGVKFFRYTYSQRELRADNVIFFIIAVRRENSNVVGRSFTIYRC